MTGVSGAFEKFAQYNDLYYGRRRLGTIGQYSISPSGRFALYEATGRLLLFDRESRQIRDVTDGVFAVPKSFVWQESTGVVLVYYFGNHAPSLIRLQTWKF